jgi:hypothetical protein
LFLPSPKKKSLALKTKREEVNDSFNKEYLDEEELAFLLKRFKNFVKLRKSKDKKKTPI